MTKYTVSDNMDKYMLSVKISHIYTLYMLKSLIFTHYVHFTPVTVYWIILHE